MRVVVNIDGKKVPGRAILIHYTMGGALQHNGSFKRRVRVRLDDGRYRLVPFADLDPDSRHRLSGKRA